MRKLKLIILNLIICLTCYPFNNEHNKLPIADPFILYHDNIYYAYGTSTDAGFEVYYSNDLKFWRKSDNMALSRADSYGNKWFWAPEVYYNKDNGKFYLYYSTEEHICVAVADSPLGPFVQTEMKPMREEKSIDSSIFVDDDGTPYLYFVRFTNGNVIWCAELEKDLVTIKEETLKQCFEVSQPWEKSLGRVVEGPSIIKKNGTYYLLYSGNDFRSQDYGVGYATSSSPMGPWKKYENNPILQKPKDYLVGTGHGAPFVDKSGKYRYIFHAHADTTSVGPRTSFIADLSISPKGIVSIGGNIIEPEIEESKPYGLLTDLIEHTDRTWQNGYLSNIRVWETDTAIEPLQFVQIGSTHPSFSWIVPGKAAGTHQTAYQVIISDTYNNATNKKGNVWDSGTVNSTQSTAVIYNGNPLQPDKVYFWRVKTTTNTSGESEWSEIKAFRTASSLSKYSASAYPLEKRMEYPVAVHSVSKNVTMVDFGKDAFAQLLLTLTSETENDSVIVHLGEVLKNHRVNREPEGTIRYQRYPLRLIKGTHTYRIKIRQDKRNTGSAAILMPDYIGEVLPFRYCEIERYDKFISAMQIKRETVFYPFDDTTSFFECSNDTLNQIWDLCKYSVKATSFAGIYVDGDRERIPYEADALINQLCHYGVDREFSMARRTHEYLLKYPTWPTEWILQSVLIAWYDYLYTGDSRSLKANYNILKARTLTQLKDKNGLISTTTGLQTPEFLASINRGNDKLRDIVDWPHTGILGLNKQEGGEADGFVFTDYNAVTNAYHYEALKLTGKIAAALNIQSDASYYNKEANNFQTKFNNTFLNKQLGYYVDGDTTTHASLHANMFPVAFGMVPKNNLNQVIEFIESRKMACSVYGSQFLMDALYEAAEAEYGLSMLTKTDDRSWYNMIRVGSTITLEAWDNKYKPNQDWNHAWGAVPANIIPRKLMGVEPLLPGFDKVRIKPQLSFLSQAKAVIPTIKGAIHLEVENSEGEYQMKVMIPANMKGEVYLPLLSNKYEVRINGNVHKTKLLKDSPFVSLGEIASGSYIISMRY